MRTPADPSASGEYKEGYLAALDDLMPEKLQHYVSLEELASTGLEPYLVPENWVYFSRLLTALACSYGNFPQKLKDILDSPLVTNDRAAGDRAMTKYAIRKTND